MKNRVLIAEFYNSGICHSEPKDWVKIKDLKDGDNLKFEDYETCEELKTTLDNGLYNLEWGNHLQIRLRIISEKQWLDAERLGRELA